MRSTIYRLKEFIQEALQEAPEKKDRDLEGMKPWKEALEYFKYATEAYAGAYKELASRVRERARQTNGKLSLEPLIIKLNERFKDFKKTLAMMRSADRWAPAGDAKKVGYDRRTQDVASALEKALRAQNPDFKFELTGTHLKSSETVPMLPGDAGRDRQKKFQEPEEPAVSRPHVRHALSNITEDDIIAIAEKKSPTYSWDSLGKEIQIGSMLDSWQRARKNESVQARLKEIGFKSQDATTHDSEGMLAIVFGLEKNASGKSDLHDSSSGKNIEVKFDQEEKGMSSHRRSGSTVHELRLCAALALYKAGRGIDITIDRTKNLKNGKDFIKAYVDVAKMADDNPDDPDLDAIVDRFKSAFDSLETFDPKLYPDADWFAYIDVRGDRMEKLSPDDTKEFRYRDISREASSHKRP